MKIDISDKKYWTRLNYYDALLYCSMVEIDGHNDWRLPSKTEVGTILKYCTKLCPFGYYWTCEQIDSETAWTVLCRMDMQPLYSYNYKKYEQMVMLVRNV
jgi:hypothetical protein